MKTKTLRCLWPLFVCLTIAGVANAVHGQSRRFPEVLTPWAEWATWNDTHRQCPTPYDDPEKHVCFWPQKLAITANAESAEWEMVVTVFHETWLPLPGEMDTWPHDVRVNDLPVAVVQRDERPQVKLSGKRQEFKITGRFLWKQMPQRIRVPTQIGLLALTVQGQLISVPNWDESGNVWLQRNRSEETAQESLAAHVYRVVEDGIPLWLRSQVDLTVSGQSREVELGWILPEGWQLASVRSPIPVAVDESGRIKAQVRAGSWTVELDAFRTSDIQEIRFASDAKPLADTELIAFQADPTLRSAELQGIPVIDVTQTTFPEKWRSLPVYEWRTDSPFQLVQKMRGTGQQASMGLTIARHLWLDDDGKNLTSRDAIQGDMRRLGRLDVAGGQELGRVRIDKAGQLITVNPKTGAPGVEVRTRSLNLEAIGRIDRSGPVSATGWQADAESLNVTLSLPPGWRMLALFGADQVEGDWLTAWSLLDLFMLLLFAMAVFRLYGPLGGVVAFFAFGLAYHEWTSPRITWFFLLMPIALLRVVRDGKGQRVLTLWKYVAIAVLLLNLIPFVARQVQSAIYPQLESPGVQYGPRYMFRRVGRAYQIGVGVADMAMEMDSTVLPSPRIMTGQDSSLSSVERTKNLSYAREAKIQTGPAEPAWNWIEVDCHWNGPVSAGQTMQMILISPWQHRALTVARLGLLAALVTILIRSAARSARQKVKPAVVASGVGLLILLGGPQMATAQLPDATMLDTLRQRLLETSDAYPHAAEIAATQLKLEGNQIRMESEIHAAIEVAVPLPGRVTEWSPVSVQIDGKPATLVTRQEQFLWILVPAGVHQVVVNTMTPTRSDWEWSFLLKPKHVTIEAPEWNVTGVSPDGVPESQVIFVRRQQLSADQAAYDRNDFHAAVAVERHLETGIVWRVRTEVSRLSRAGKVISLSIPLLPGERVLSPDIDVNQGSVELRLAGHASWVSELPVGTDIQLTAPANVAWVERWHLDDSPVWNVAVTGIKPFFEATESRLVPIWHPWPGESVQLRFSKPQPVSGQVTTVQSVQHVVKLGQRQSDIQLICQIECSVGSDFAIAIPESGEIVSLTTDNAATPIRRSGDQVFVPLHPGKQTIDLNWRMPRPLGVSTSVDPVTLATDSANITTTVEVPDSRWVLWTHGPLQGPAVRFWTLLACAIGTALLLGQLPNSPLRRYEWVLLAIGLTQVHVAAALVVVAWLFLLDRRGRFDFQTRRPLSFNAMQIGIVMMTLAALAILIVVVSEGLLGNPKMFILGNGSNRFQLRWFVSRANQNLPQPQVVSVSMWYYRLLMLLWALWLASAVLRWLVWGWNQFSHGGAWIPGSAKKIVHAQAVK